MATNEYVDLAMRTNDGNSTEHDVAKISNYINHAKTKLIDGICTNTIKSASAKKLSNLCAHMQILLTAGDENGET